MLSNKSFLKEITDKMKDENHLFFFLKERTWFEFQY